MKKMNKRECLEFIISKMREEHEKRTEAKTWEEYNSINCYEECKNVCAENGYTDECFYDLWTRANTTIAREQGIYPNLPLYMRMRRG